MYKILLGVLLLIFSASSLSAEETSYENVTELYVATFERAPDGAGLMYWVNDSGLSPEETCSSFFDQLETKEKYPSSLSTVEFVKTVYNNLFNRDPDSEGLEYWAKSLDSQSVTRPVFILAVINGAQGDDAKILTNKTTIGLTFAKTGNTDPARASLVLESITADSDSVMVSMCLSGLGECPIKKTGKTKSYNSEGEEVTDGSIKDDGFYKRGIVADYRSRDNEKETIVDNVTGLEWQDNEDVVNNGTYYSEEAIEYCQDLKLGGYTDWRLPTVSQLVTIVDRGTNQPAIDIKFVYTAHAKYRTYDGWLIDFEYGSMSSNYSYGYIRCARSADK